MNHLDEDGKQKGENRRDDCVQEVFMVFFCLFPSLSLSHFDVKETTHRRQAGPLLFQSFKIKGRFKKKKFKRS